MYESRRNLVIVKAKGNYKGIYFVQPKEGGMSFFKTNSLEEAKKYIALHKKYFKIKDELHKVENQIYNMKEDLDVLSKIYLKNRGR